MEAKEAAEVQAAAEARATVAEQLQVAKELEEKKAAAEAAAAAAKTKEEKAAAEAEAEAAKAEVRRVYIPGEYISDADLSCATVSLPQCLMRLGGQEPPWGPDISQPRPEIRLHH